ncbi:hypothetical protein Ndes2526A_g01018 [Nannochloris sp. 'desiccata']
MGSSFSPYNDRPLACGEVSGINCLESWRDLLFIGRKDGSLSIFKESANVGNPGCPFVWKPHSVKRLGQQIFQLAVSLDRSLLFCLTEEGVSLFSLPQLLMKGQAGGTRGSTCFAWDDSTNQLAVAVKKRIIIYNYDGLEFVYKREIVAAEPPVALHILSGTVFISTKSEYSAALPSGNVVELGSAQEGPYGFAACGKEVLVCLGKDISIVDQNGKVLATKSASWSNNPSIMVVSGLHLVALVPGGIEVQLLAPRTALKLSQEIKMKDFTVLCAMHRPEGGVFLGSATTGQIVCLLPLPKIKQAEQLLKAGAFEDALEVSRQIPDSQKTVQTDLDSRIRLAYGRHLLSEQRYEEAMLNLGMSSYSDPLEILRSFPFLVPETLAQKTALGTSELAQFPSSEEEMSKIVAILTPYLLSYRSRLAAGAVEGGATAATAAHVFGSPSIGTLIDTALLNAFLLLPDNGALLQFIQRANDIDLETGSTALENAGRYAELVALYKAHNRHAAALEVLEKLILRPDTLQMGAKGAAIELTGLPGVWAAIQYLSSHEPRDFSLISSHAKWILKQDPEAGIEMFVRLYPEVNPSVVLPILSSFGPELAASYLSKIVDEAGAEERMFHQDLAVLYLQDNRGHEKLRDLILSSDYLNFDALLRLLPPKGLWEVRAAIYERLGRHLDALRILYHNLGSLALAEAYCDRVIAKHRPSRNLFSNVPKMPQNPPLPGQEPAYALLVQIMLEEDDKTRPGTYCVKDYGPDDHIWKQIAELLSRKRDALNPLTSLSLLPKDVPLSSCIHLLEGAMRGMNEEKRKTKILANLYRARHLTAMCESTDVQQKAITINQEKACWICHKRLSGKKGWVSALVHLPGGSIAHYSCYKSQVSATN